MNVTWGLLTVLGLVCHSESRCSPNSYYKNCWIRRFPGIFIDIEESQRRGAQLLQFYQEDTALRCSRTCCLTRNFSCNLAIFHYDTTQENCFHLHCPTLESCILSRRGNVVLYNITTGVDPDLLVFGKYFTSNVRVLPHHYSRVNASDPLPSDKRHFVHPPPPAAPPPTSTPTAKPPATASGVITAATALQSTSRPSTASATAASPSTPKTLPAPAHTVTPTTSYTFLSPVTPSSSTVTAPGPQSSAVSATAGQSSTSPTHHHSNIFSQSASSPPIPATGIIESSKQHHNETKGSLEGGGEPDVSGGAASGGSGPGLNVAAGTFVVAVGVCITVVLSCCCSVVLVVSLRGQRRRMGRYQTSWGGKRGSMRLIKYVLVRENT